VRFTRDRWGNALSQSDPRNETWKTYFTYNHNNQVVEEKRPDAAGDLGTSSPTRSICYDKLGRQVAIRDERGFVNGQAYDLAGNLIRETHADGGVITHAWDIFGQKAQTIDAIGNATADGSTKTDHTTRFDYGTTIRCWVRVRWLFRLRPRRCCLQASRLWRHRPWARPSMS
jgi:YD repeat-containing protein